MYTVASPDPDPDANPRGGGQLPNPNECNSTLTSGNSGRDVYKRVELVPNYPFGSEVSLPCAKIILYL